MAGISILVADDSITIQKVIGIIFGSEEYSLTIVDNGKAAVQKAQEVNPDVLLIDALMPGMSGYEVCEAIRKDAALATKPVLLLTGSFEPFDEDKARQCGADDHIVKPFESQQIVAKVRELYALGVNRANGVSTPVAEETAPVAPAEPLVAEEPFVFEQTAIEPAAVAEPPATEESTYSFQSDAAFEPTSSLTVPVEEPAPLRTPDDPWGAFTQQPAEAEVSAVSQEPAPAAFDAADQPDVMALMNEDAPLTPAPESVNEHIGASWVPVEEQTFEFREEVAFTPSPVMEEETTPAAEESEPPSAFTTDVFEPAAALEPVVEEVAELPAQVAPSISASAVTVAPEAGAVTLTEEQLKAALLSASRETIERIVWEVVPDLAETMIREAIKKITQEQ